ncbi:MAG TPA: DUF167 domain-containing protein [Polyangiales bacterium]|nr:DUF167 domain-containing protein [Polyangiales bacterium]
MLALHSHGAAVSFEVRVTPRASRSQIRGLVGTALKVNLAAPPVDGAANAALCELLAEVLGVPRRAVEISHGHQSKRKTVRVTGLTLETVRERLAAVGH